MIFEVMKMYISRILIFIVCGLFWFVGLGLTFVLMTNHKLSDKDRNIIDGMAIAFVICAVIVSGLFGIGSE